MFRTAVTRLSMAIVPLFAATISVAQKLPDLYHGEWHGDPPFLSQSGWRPLLNGKDLSGWHAEGGTPPAEAPDARVVHDQVGGWFTTRSVNWNRVFGPKTLIAKSAPGDRIVNGHDGRAANLVTDEKFGSFELYLEFMNARGSNSGVYLHGLYEVQIFDSYGFDC